MSAVALVVAGILLVVAAGLRAGGASLVRTPRADALHDAAEGNRQAQVVANLLEDRARLQPAIGVVHAALLVIGSVLAAWAVTDLASDWIVVASLVVLAVVAVLIGDVLPRSWGRTHPRRLAYRLSALLARAARLGERAADLIYDVEDEEEEAGTDEDVEEMNLISSVLEFTDTVVREVMVPRPDMVVVAGDASTQDALELAVAAGRSRIPVTGEGLDDIVGILYAKDLLPLLGSGSGPVAVRDAMRAAYFVPETKRVFELLREMQANQVHMSVVVDEFGGTAGLVTIEDLIEELVGEIVDEYDVEEPMVTPLDSGAYLVDARLHVTDLGELLDTELPDEEWDTVGGLMLALAGRVPREGESFEFDGFVLTADRVQGRRVSQVRISRR